MSDVFAFQVTVAGEPTWGKVINAHSAGKAKADYWRQVTDPWPDVPYTAIRCRKLGPPVTSESFARTATYRGLAHVRCGDRVVCGAARGVIVGNNSSANFDVLFDIDSPEFPGLRLNCHPGELTFPPSEPSR
jgi:hypothetical protein